MINYLLYLFGQRREGLASFCQRTFSGKERRHRGRMDGAAPGALAQSDDEEYDNQTRKLSL